MSRRSCLVVPGHLAKHHRKALHLAADEVVFDLEDAVAADGKVAAREQIAATLAEPGWEERAVAVRVNPIGSEHLEADLALVRGLARSDVTVVVPKVQDARQLDALGEGLELQALLETPLGLARAAEIAAHPAVVALILGYADLAAALGRREDQHDPHRWLVPQEALLAAARVGGAQAIDGPWFALGDLAGLGAAARHARELGYDGKWAIHPEQVDPLNTTFAPSADELTWAEEVRAAVEHAADQGSAVARVGQAMVDEAMVRQADRLLALPRPPEEPPAAPAEAGVTETIAAPYFDQLDPGAVFRSPGLTLTGGHAALHQAVVGDRLRLSLDAPLCAAVTGRPGLLAHPMLVCDVAIGQSTPPSGRVLGNLFYRGLGMRPVRVGDTLRTRTEVVARRGASGGRGIVALRVTTTDEQGAPVLDFWRCPLLPTTPGTDVETGGDDLEAIGAPADARSLVPEGWTLGPLREQPLGRLFADLEQGAAFRVEAGETVTGAPELVRLSLNLAMTHTDASAGAHGRRLVYGGHVIGIAAAHLTRVLPDLATILAWDSCDHLGPTFEGDLLHTRLDVLGLEPLDDGGLVRLRARVDASAGDGEPRDVLDWTLVGLMP